MSDIAAIDAAVRTEFGKGAARRTRREGLVPAVLYGHQSTPRHVALNHREFAAILRNNGSNAVLTLTIEGEKQFALTKSVVVHPLRRYIEHADLLVVHRGEKVTVDVPIEVVGTPAPGIGLVNHESATISVEADALSIPDHLEVSIEGADIGALFHASDVVLPRGVALHCDPDTLIASIIAPQSEEPTAEAATEAATSAAEGESAAS